MKKSKVDVIGMHCAACSSRIERVLAATEGVMAASVNLAAETLDLEWDEQSIGYDEIQERIRNLGFELGSLPERNESTLEFSIGGMHCASCSSRIENVVGKLAGVHLAEVNLATESARVIVDRTECGIRKIRETIEGLGFTATISGDRVEEFSQKRAAALTNLQEMKKRLVAMLLLAVPLLYIAMGEMVGLPLPYFLTPHAYPLAFGLCQLILVLPIVWLGRSFYLIGIPALIRKIPNMDSLIAVGTGSALIYSCWNLAEIALGIDPMHKAMDLYFESAGVLIALVSLGKYMETRSKLSTSDAIRQLLELTPDKATLLENGEQREISAEAIEHGDILLIRPGERIAVDGKITEGESSIDESMLTGESMPVTKSVSDTVYGGTLNRNGVLKIECQKTGGNTVLARIVRMVQEAQGSKAPIASLADRISLYFVPTVMAIAAITGILWFLVGGVEFTQALRFFIAVMVIACPCAMGLATPTSLMVGMGRGAQLGILVRNGAALELSEKIGVIVLDKTGTLTEGKPEVTDVVVFDDMTEDQFVQLVASAEQSSEHPLAEAVVNYAKKKNLQLVQPSVFTAFGGRGIGAIVNGQKLNVGNREFMVENEITIDSSAMKKIEALSDRGKTVLFVAVGNSLQGYLAVADKLKPESVKAVEHLKKQGMRLVMLTGDQQKTAEAIAAEAGISEVIAEVLPEDKAKNIIRFQEKGLKVAMVGDGINDAPALAQADVGIAMGTGIDIAVESGDIVLMKGNLDGIYGALALSKAVMRNIRQNLFWAFAFNVIGIPVAAGVLYIFGGPTLNPMLAGAAMAMSSVTVVTNALRLRFFSIT
ncbi:heavy metal translocating P-type ATPase [Desulfopila aestuarii]|uniref:heavy metal translocating P-type ATPase n=1 Tax=Desulfopila aestuarii TaxID=231440 RepID=UPI0009376980|nr:heavy metal translocating P-type ATPase [Desulfopila aestuarii]